MTFKKHGSSISEIEVINVALHGFWLFVENKEYFLPYSEFPWFREAKISEIFDVQLLHSHHLFWSQLDVDLELASLERIEDYPLLYC